MSEHEESLLTVELTVGGREDGETESIASSFVGDHPVKAEKQIAYGWKEMKSHHDFFEQQVRARERQVGRLLSIGQRRSGFDEKSLNLIADCVRQRVDVLDLAIGPDAKGSTRFRHEHGCEFAIDLHEGGEKLQLRFPSLVDRQDDGEKEVSCRGWRVP